MPTTSGKLMLQDYDDALRVRGFEMFSPDERKQHINLGYREVARKFPSVWEQVTEDFPMDAGDVSLDIMSGLPLTPASVKLVYAYGDSSGRRKLEVDNYKHFTERWLSADLGSGDERGLPDRYFVYGNKIYVLPPPQGPVIIEIHFYQYLPDLKEDADVSILPQVMDEVVLDASLVRCHRRVHELQLASEAQMRVDLALEDLLTSEVFQLEELQERVRPDDTWL